MYYPYHFNRFSFIFLFYLFINLIHSQLRPLRKRDIKKLRLNIVGNRSLLILYRSRLLRR